MQSLLNISPASSFPAARGLSSSPFATMIVTDLSFLGPLGDPNIQTLKTPSLRAMDSWTPWDAIQLLF